MTPDQTTALAALLHSHAPALHQLLPPHLWPVRPFKVEQFGPLTKYTLGQAEDGRWVMLHRIDGPDAAPPHSHPCRFDSHGIAGSYWERVYHADGRTERVLRAAGGNHTIWPDTVHCVVGLPEGEAWTLAFAGPVVQEAQHYPELA